MNANNKCIVSQVVAEYQATDPDKGDACSGFFKALEDNGYDYIVLGDFDYVQEGWFLSQSPLGMIAVRPIKNPAP